MSLDFVGILYNEGMELPKEEEYYDRAILEIDKEKIAPQVYSLLKRQGNLNLTPVSFQQKLKQKYEKGLYQNLIIKSQFDCILERLDEQAIDVIPLKGVFMAEKYFGHTGARPTGDIDILIRHRDIEKTIEIVKSLGFILELEVIPDHFHCSFGKVLPYSEIPLTVEIHWNLVKENTSDFTIEDIWKDTKPIGDFKHVKEMAPLHTFYMVCLHGWRHNLDSAKYFIDILQILHFYHNHINYDELIKLAENHQTKKRIIRTLSIVYKQFSYLDSFKILSYKRAMPFWRYKQGKGLKLYLDFLDYQLLSYDKFSHVWMEFTQWVSSNKTKSNG
ncbi:nucleotidyltransferase family protein [Bacillus sp. ISL-41]|uniref:nucleotidyltransferase domain-containing protein n=1 Tax=Bacillus sp. ISL-41 TaxID=2819127 RepID=UPI001BE5DAFA|nr:nucleotidyltransferase family protein [Bacillus sp. ISL-41]MBT2642223.1 nucleotidyltransferase family protein [Bacillus sp. ISL-41]